MRFFKNGILDEWHFVIGDGAGDVESFYRQLEEHLQPNVESLKLKTGYTMIGIIFNKRRAHFAKYGGYQSLTSAEPFGTDLNISWYLYYTKAELSKQSTALGMSLSNFLGHFTGKTQDRIVAFASIGKDCAQRATETILSSKEEPVPEPSGQFGRV